MIMTDEERLMYDVMKAIYDSGIPISFKGSMVLKAFLAESGYQEETRHTVDIDANWNSDVMPTGKQMTDSLQEAINRESIKLNVGLYRMYGKGRSAGFELTDSETGDLLFTMDIDVNRPVQSTQVYELSGICFRGATANQMIADKVASISTDKVFRRIKDVVDLYYLSKVCKFDTVSILKTLEDSERELGNFEGLRNRYDDLKHAYEKFRFSGDVRKLQFEEIYNTVNKYIQDILPQ